MRAGRDSDPVLFDVLENAIDSVPFFASRPWVASKVRQDRLKLADRL